MGQAENDAVAVATQIRDRVAAQGERPVSAAELHGIQKDIAALLIALRKNQELRKWAVEKAVEVCGKGEVKLQGGGTLSYDTVGLAREIYDFIMQEQIKVADVISGEPKVS